MKLNLRFLVALFCLCLFFQTDLSAQETSSPVLVQIVGSDSLSADEFPAGELIAIPRFDSSEIVRLPLTDRRTLELDTSGPWELSIEAENFWSPSVLVVPRQETSATLKLYPTIEIQGRSIFPTGAAAEEILPPKARFRSAGSRGGDAPLEGESECAGATSEAEPRTLSWNCRVPVGRFDLRLRTAGFVSLYLWDQEIAAEAAPKIDDWKLRRGASLVGWVETDERTVPEGPTQLVLKPRTDLLTSTRDQDRAALRGRTLAADAEGFFHFEGLDAGAYTLSVAHETYAPQRIGPILMQENSESALGEAIVLRRPLHATIRIEPSRDAQDGRWTLLLAEQTTDVPVATGLTDDQGEWIHEDAKAGAYRLTVSDSKGRRVKTETFELTPESAELFLTVEYLEITGRVTFADEPLPGAALHFGGMRGGGVRLETDEEGLFEGLIAEDALSRLDLSSKSPSILRRFRKIEPETQDGRLWLEIDLPDTQISGRVIDEKGRPLTSISILGIISGGAEFPGQVFVDDEDGEFEIRGAALGKHVLEAYAVVPDGREVRGEAQEVELTKSNPQTEIDLIVRDQNVFHGTVTSAVGPVAGAQIRLSQSGYESYFMSVAPQGRTDAQGEFQIATPPQLETARALVMARGFVLHDQIVQIGDEPAQFMLRSGGGHLLIDFPDAEWSSSTLYRVPITRDSQPLDLTTLVQWARINGVVQAPRRLTVPALEPGLYEVCIFPNGEEVCRSGSLLEGGDLVLTFVEEKQEGE